MDTNNVKEVNNMSVLIDGQVYQTGDFTIEYCPFCDSEQVIYAKGITACPHCGKPLAPCSVCDKCSYKCPYGCDGSENDEFKKVTNPPLTEAFGEQMSKFL